MTGSGFGEWYSGSIDIRGDWDNPYLASSPYDREYVHTGWALWVDMNPHVWVEATDAEAKEDNRDEAKFSVKREGGDPSQAITVHIGFGGSATASDQPASAFPEGVAWNDEADYTVEGATYDPNTGSWTVEIPAGQTSADVTVKPLNDSAYEETESIQFAVLNDPDGVDGGEYALAATHEATTNPATKPATTQAVQTGLNIEAMKPQLNDDKDGNVPSVNDRDALVDRLEEADPVERKKVEDALKQILKDYPSTRDYFLQKYEDTPADPPSIRAGLRGIIGSEYPFTLTTTGNVIQVKYWGSGGGADRRIDLQFQSDAGFWLQHVGQPPQPNTNILHMYSGGGSSFSSLRVITRSSGITQLSVTRVEQTRDPVTGEWKDDLETIRGDNYDLMIKVPR